MEDRSPIVEYVGKVRIRDNPAVSSRNRQTQHYSPTRPSFKNFRRDRPNEKVKTVWPSPERLKTQISTDRSNSPCTTHPHGRSPGHICPSNTLEKSKSEMNRPSPLERSPQSTTSPLDRVLKISDRTEF